MSIRRDLARTTLAIFCIVGLAALSLWVLLPFLAATVWAATIVVATWPLFRTLEDRLGGRRAPAVALMTLTLLFVLVLPLWLAFDTIDDHYEQLLTAISGVAQHGLPRAPEWLAQLPLIGGKAAAQWNQFTAGGARGLAARLAPYAADTGRWLLSQVGGLGGMLLQFAMVLAISAILYARGEAASRLLCRFGHRLAGDRGEQSILLAGRATRAVALGIGVTALVQSVLGGIGLAVAGVPFAALLSALMLMLCIAQIGPLPVLLAGAGWLFWSDQTGWGIFLSVWSVIVAGLDNFLRPMLIRRGADLPLLLIFAGVLGGMLGFGLIGLFIGPVVLAVTWTLTQAWIDDETLPVKLTPAQADQAEPPAA